MAEITAEQVKCGCINAVRERKCYPFFTDLGIKQILLTQCKNLQCLHQFKFTFRFLFQQLGCFCQAENSWQE